MPRPLQAQSGSGGLFGSSLFAPTPSSPGERIPVTSHSLVRCPPAQSSSWAWGSAPKGYGGATAFSTALSTASVPQKKKKKNPRSCCKVTSFQEKEACELTNSLQENTHFCSHHPFNPHEDSNRNYRLGSAFLRVSGKFIRFAFAQTLLPVTP